MQINNKGNGCAEDFEIDFSLECNKMITDKDVVYIPERLSDRVVKSNQTDTTYYSKLSSFPGNSTIECKFYFNYPIKSERDFNYSILSKDNNWTESAKIKPKYSFLKLSENEAFAQDNQANSEDSKPKKSGIFIGGYDPLVMSNGMFALLQNKKLISNKDAQDIKKLTESYKEGVLFGGINILKYNELILNKLIDNKHISIEQANQIIAKSKKSGGVMVGGYNVIVLEVEILNTLLKSSKISFEEGQSIIDNAKQ